MRANGITEAVDVLKQAGVKFLQGSVSASVRLLLLQIYEEALHDRIVVGMTFDREGLNHSHLIQALLKGFGSEPAASVRVKNHTVTFAASSKGGVGRTDSQMGINVGGDFVHDDFSGIQIHDRTQAFIPRANAYMGEIAHPSAVGCCLAEPLR